MSPLFRLFLLVLLVAAVLLLSGCGGGSGGGSNVAPAPSQPFGLCGGERIGERVYHYITVPYYADIHDATTRYTVTYTKVVDAYTCDLIMWRTN